MDVLVQIKIILLYGAILLSIYTVFLLMLGPLKFIGKAIIKISVGGVSLFLLNEALHILNINFGIGINLTTSVITGFLGVFGVLAMALMKYFLI